MKESLLKIMHLGNTVCPNARLKISTLVFETY